MAIRAQYNIKIHDPEAAANAKATTGRSRNGNSCHTVHYIKGGKLVKLPVLLEAIYRLFHQRFDDEFSFDCYFDGDTKFVFDIAKSSDWIFADKPFTVDGVKTGEIFNNGKQAIFTIPGSGTRGKGEIVYHLHYIKMDGSETLTHDPIINNGSTFPFIPKNELFDINEFNDN